MTPLTFSPAAEPLVIQAREDLAGRTGVPAGEIAVVAVEPVQWRDTSLGLPHSGEAYAQVITPGWRIVLLAGQRLAQYHASHQRVVPAD